MTSYRSNDCVASLILAVHEFSAQNNTRTPGVCMCSPADAPRLLTDMRAYDRAFVVRRVLEHLQLDQSLPFTFRVDHKLIQGLLLNHFIPSGSLQVIGLGEAHIVAGSLPIGAFLDAMFPKGYVIKASYGYASGRTRVLTSAATLAERLHDTMQSFKGTVDTESYFVQQRFDAVREYRIHTLERDVIPSLTFRTRGSLTSMSELERESVNSFVTTITEALPAALIANSLCGWDIGVDEAGLFRIFEINYAGLHPHFMPGFHCSAYLQDPIDGTLNIARLMQFASKRHQVRFDIQLSPAANPLETDAASVLYQVDRWLWLLSLADNVYDMWKDTYKSVHSVNDREGTVESIRNVILANAATPTERRYCQHLDWLKKMTEDLR